MGRRYRGIGLGFLARVAALRASLSRSSIYRSPLKIRIWCGAVDLRKDTVSLPFLRDPNTDHPLSIASYGGIEVQRVLLEQTFLRMVKPAHIDSFDLHFGTHNRSTRLGRTPRKRNLSKDSMPME